MAKIDEVMTGLNPKADARLARDIADHSGDATDMIPPAKAADADGWDYYAWKGDTAGNLYRYRPGMMYGDTLAFPNGAWMEAETRRGDFEAEDTLDFGPATRAECERFLGWTKAATAECGECGLPDGVHHSPGCDELHAQCVEGLPPVMLGPDSTARIDAELARVRCSCGQPKPTALTAENDAHLRRVLRNNIQSLQEVADDLRIEGPFPDCAERDLLVATARAVIRHAEDKQGVTRRQFADPAEVGKTLVMVIKERDDLLAALKSLRDIIHDDLTHAQQQHHAEAINFADLVIAKAGGGA